MRALFVLMGAAACVGAAAFGCSSSPSSGGGGSGGGGASSSAAGMSSSSSSSASSSVSSSSASATSSGSGMTAGMICSDCSGKVFMMDAMCQASLNTCQADMDCAAWVTCTNACLTSDPPTTQCFAACDQAASVVSNLYQPIYDCICAVSACKTECSFACP